MKEVENYEAQDLCNQNSQCAGYAVCNDTRAVLFELPSVGSNCSNNADWTVYAKPVKSMLYSPCQNSSDDDYCAQFNENLVCALAGQEGRNYGGCNVENTAPGDVNFCCSHKTEI